MIKIEIELPETDARELAQAVVRRFRQDLAQLPQDELDTLLADATKVKQYIEDGIEAWAEQIAKHAEAEKRTHEVHETVRATKRLNFRERRIGNGE